MLWAMIHRAVFHFLQNQRRPYVIKKLFWRQIASKRIHFTRKPTTSKQTLQSGDSAPKMAPLPPPTQPNHTRGFFSHLSIPRDAHQTRVSSMDNGNPSPISSPSSPPIRFSTKQWKRGRRYYSPPTSRRRNRDHPGKDVKMSGRVISIPTPYLYGESLSPCWVVEDLFMECRFFIDFLEDMDFVC